MPNKNSDIKSEGRVSPFFSIIWENTFLAVAHFFWTSRIVAKKAGELHLESLHNDMGPTLVGFDLQGLDPSRNAILPTFGGLP